MTNLELANFCKFWHRLVNSISDVHASYFFDMILSRLTNGMVCNPKVSEILNF